VVELRVKTVGQLFHSFDPFPFLDKEVEDYIVSWVRMHANDQPIKIVIRLPEQEVDTKAANELAAAFARYFGYHADLLQHDLDELYRDGRRFLVIGMTILGVMPCAGSGSGQASNRRPIQTPTRTGSSDFGLGRKLASARDIALRLVATQTSPRSISPFGNRVCRD
jgi:hypothetical protein